MKKSAQSQRRQERLKLVVIPILVLILVAVLAWPAAKESAAPTTVQPTSPIAHVSTVASSSPTPAPAFSSTPAAVPAPQWPTVELRSITATNPFTKKPVVAAAAPQTETANPWLQLATNLASLVGTPQPDARPSATNLAAVDNAAAPALDAAADSPATELIAEPVAPPIDFASVGRLCAIVHDETGRYALLDGNRIVFEGDDIPNGFRVEQISDDKIWVRRLAD